ncbi:MAG: hypothetical protein GC165_09980 [Armatimonadetes bacterium]|nr:hypothetical protein [Armatimonadota bacterium]
MPVLPFLVAAAGAKITLQYHPKVGSSYRFSVTSSGQTPMGSSTVNAVTALKVLSHEKDSYRVEMRVSNVKNGGNAPTANLDKAVYVLDYDSYGQMKADPKSASAGAQRLLGGFGNETIGMQFAHHPVAVGDTWTNTVDMGKIMATMSKGQAKNPVGTVVMTFKLVQASTKSAVISCTLKGGVKMEVTAGSGANKRLMQVSQSMSGGGQYTVERSTGVYLASNLKIQTATTAGSQHFSSSQSVSMKRL